MRVSKSYQGDFILILQLRVVQLLCELSALTVCCAAFSALLHIKS